MITMSSPIRIVIAVSSGLGLGIVMVLNCVSVCCLLQHKHIENELCFDITNYQVEQLLAYKVNATLPHPLVTPHTVSQLALFNVHTHTHVLYVPERKERKETFCLPLNLDSYVSGVQP